MDMDVLLERLASPARRALGTLGLKRIEDLSRYSKEQIMELHGIGPNALRVIESEMKAVRARFKIGSLPGMAEGHPSGISPIDEYISAFPPEVQAILRKLRETIRRAAPEARETISYRMPAFDQNGVLVYFAAFENHIGFYPTPAPVAVFARELALYKTSKGAIKFPIDKPLPWELIGRIVQYRVQENAGAGAGADSVERKSVRRKSGSEKIR